MNIQISNASNAPIYSQIKNQLRDAILTGTLEEGAQLPSIRLLAKELRISVITTKRAYDELENEGFIHSVQGKGSFVAGQNKELVRENMLRQMEKCLSEALHYATLAGLSRSEMVETLMLLEEGNEKRD